MPVGGGGAWPVKSQRHKHRRCGGRRRVRRARAGFEIDHSERSSRVAISRAAEPDTIVPKSQTTSPITAHFQCFSPRWSAVWALHHLKPPPRNLKQGELHDTRLRYADNTPPGGFM